MFDYAHAHSQAFGDSARRHSKAALKAERLVGKEDAKVYATRAGLGIGAATGVMHGIKKLRQGGKDDT